MKFMKILQSSISTYDAFLESYSHADEYITDGFQLSCLLTKLWHFEKCILQYVYGNLLPLKKKFTFAPFSMGLSYASMRTSSFI